jgi:plasmid stabilization system protein ParE
MNPAVIITPAAEGDIAEGRNWYNSVSPELAIDFRSALDDALARIADRPNAHALVARGLRRAFLRRFPYAVFYRSQMEAIQVIAVLHPSRCPQVWQARNH